MRCGCALPGRALASPLLGLIRQIPDPGIDGSLDCVCVLRRIVLGRLKSGARIEKDILLIARKTVRYPSSISHDEAMVKELRENPEFAAEYLKAALEDSEEPAVLAIAVGRVAKAQKSTTRTPHKR